MKSMRIRTILIGLVAAFAISVVAAATASATTMPLIVNGSGVEPVKKGFTSESGKSEFETLAGHVVKCEKDTDTGTLTGPSTDESTIKFTGCTTTFIVTLKCQTGSTKGEIVLKVKSELVWLDKTESKEPGEDLQLPEGGITIECTGLATEKVKVTGSTLCPISGFHTLSSTGTISCKLESGKKGMQEHTKYFLGGVEKTDETITEGSGAMKFGPEQSGLTSSDSLKYEEAVEIM